MMTNKTHRLTATKINNNVIALIKEAPRKTPLIPNNVKIGANKTGEKN